MYKYAQLESFYRDLQLQVYMYDFMYVDTDTLPVEDHFPDTKYLLLTKINFQLQDQSQSIGLGSVACVQKIMS